MQVPEATADEPNVQVAIRIPASWLVRADALAQSSSKPGLRITRTDILRTAIVEGLVYLTVKRDKKTKRRK